jgi:hypothetical protein
VIRELIFVLILNTEHLPNGMNPLPAFVACKASTTASSPEERGSYFIID